MNTKGTKDTGTPMHMSAPVDTRRRVRTLIALHCGNVIFNMAV